MKNASKPVLLAHFSFLLYSPYLSSVSHSLVPFLALRPNLEISLFVSLPVKMEKKKLH